MSVKLWFWKTVTSQIPTCKPSIAENITINYDIFWRKNHFGAEWGLLIRIILYCFHTAVKKNASELFIFWENIWTLKRNLCPFIPSSNKCEFLSNVTKAHKSPICAFCWSALILRFGGNGIPRALSGPQ